MLIVFAGPACTGKSTLATEIARRRAWPHLSMDGARQRILPDAAHTPEDRTAAYRAMHWAAELLLGAGAHAVLDAPYRHDNEREELARIAGGRMKLIECRVAPDTAVERLRVRGLPDPTRPDLTEERVRRLNLQYRYTGAGLLLDTGLLSFEECLARIEAFLA